MSTKLNKFELRTSSNDAAYLMLPDYPLEKKVKVSKSIDVTELIEGYRGCDIRLDFDEDGTLIGIEILY